MKNRCKNRELIEQNNTRFWVFYNFNYCQTDTLNFFDHPASHFIFIRETLCNLAGLWKCSTGKGFSRTARFLSVWLTTILWKDFDYIDNSRIDLIQASAQIKFMWHFNIKGWILLFPVVFNGMKRRVKQHRFWNCYFVKLPTGALIQE